MSEQIATERLRKLLDERGVDWWAEDDSSEPAYYFVTKWFANGSEQTYEEIPAIRSRSLKGYCVTPEQAIAATLGNDGAERSNDGVDERTTTRDTTRTVYGNKRPVCEVCGYGIGDRRWSYCPKCGAWIVEVDDVLRTE